MKFNSKNLFPLILLVFVWMGDGCSTQTPTSTALSAPAHDQYAIVNIAPSAAPPVYPNGGVANSPHITGATIGNYLINNTASANGYIEAVSYSTPLTVSGGPTPFELVPAGFEYYNETWNTVNYIYNGGSNFSLSQVGYSWSITPTGLTDGYDTDGIHIVGYMNDPENPMYPPGAGNLDGISLEVSPNGGAYNVSPYQGIEFYIYINPSDSAVDRQFLVNVEQNTPQSGGGVCLSADQPSLTKCYDAYLDDYTNLAKGQWILVQEPWGQFKQYGFGSVTSPPTLTSTNLQQMAVFQWVESNTGDSGPVTVNFTISGIRFF